MTFVEKLIIARGTLLNYIVTIFFGIGALLFYFMLYSSCLVPKYISLWGIIATIGILLTMLIPITAIQPILGLPIILNEIYLGIYLIIKGFHITGTEKV